MSQFTTIRQYFRRYAETPWYEETAAYRQHVNDTYHATGKIISSTLELDDDQMILTKTVVWANEEYRDAFINDPVFIADLELRDLHHETHGITFRMVTPSLD